MSSKSFSLLLAAALVTGVSAGIYAIASGNQDETKLRSQLANHGVLATWGGNGKQVASVNFGTLKDKTKFEAAFSTVTQLSALTSLIMDRMPISDAHLQQVRGMKSLTSISLKECIFGSKGIQHVTALPLLESLNLSGTNLSDQDLPLIGQLSRLAAIDLSKTGVSHDLSPLAKLPKLKLLVLSGVQLEPGALATLAESHSLTRVNLAKSEYSQQDLEHLKNARPNLAIDE